MFHKSTKEGTDVNGVEMIELPLLDTAVIPGVTHEKQIKYTNEWVVKFLENGYVKHLKRKKKYLFPSCNSSKNSKRRQLFIIFFTIPRR